jgi:hypothetical protein
MQKAGDKESDFKAEASSGRTISLSESQTEGKKGTTMSVFCRLLLLRQCSRAL